MIYIHNKNTNNNIKHDIQIQDNEMILQQVEDVISYTHVHSNHTSQSLCDEYTDNNSMNVINEYVNGANPTNSINTNHYTLIPDNTMCMNDVHINELTYELQCELQQCTFNNCMTYCTRCEHNVCQCYLYRTNTDDDVVTYMYANECDNNNNNNTNIQMQTNLSSNWRKPLPKIKQQAPTRSQLCSIINAHNQSELLPVYVDNISSLTIPVANKNKNNKPVVAKHNTLSNVNFNKHTPFYIGDMPAEEQPERPKTYTPTNSEIDIEQLCNEINKAVEPLLQTNRSLTNNFINHPNAVVHLDVDKQHYNKLNIPQYKIAHILNKALDETMQRWLKTDKIEIAPPNCIFNAPLLCAPKWDKNGNVKGVRICLDVRQLNKYLIEDDKFQLPYVRDLLEKFRNCKYFGEFDLTEAYFQMQIHPDSRKFVAFTYKNVQYMFKGCPFGIKHIPSIFQRFMCHLMRDLTFVYPYIDNLPFASKTFEEHVEHAQCIINRLNQYGIKLNMKEINLINTDIRILGCRINAQGIHVDPNKQLQIDKWPKPRSGEEIAAFLGLATFLRDHIRHYADIEAPLISLKRQKCIEWDEVTTTAFNTLKSAIKHAPYLTYPNYNARFVIATDASWYAIGAVVYQPNDEGDTITPDNMIAIYSKKLTETQQRYPIYKKELWAVIYALRKAHTYIWGRDDNRVYTDHKPLIHILTQRQLSVALQQWLDTLLAYDLTIRYRPGLLHVVPDQLSRLYAYAYNEDETWGLRHNIHLQQIANEILTPSDILTIESINNELFKKKKREHKGNNAEQLPKKQQIINEQNAQVLQHNNNLVQSIVQDMNINEYNDIINEDNNKRNKDIYINAVSTRTRIYNNSNITNKPSSHRLVYGPNGTLTNTSSTQGHNDNSMSNNNINKHNNITYYHNHVNNPHHDSEVNNNSNKASIVYDAIPTHTPETEEDKRKLIEQAHAAGHFGANALYKHLTNKGYWWSSIMNDIRKQIQACIPCQQYNIARTGFHPRAYPSATLPWDHIIIDLVEFTETATTSAYALVIIDVFTNFLILRALPEAKGEDVARQLHSVFALLGPPKILQSDRGSQFLNQVMQAFTHLHQVRHRFVAAYHPQTNGKVERVISTVRTMLNKLMGGSILEWPHYLEAVQYYYNNKINEITQSTPFSLLFGRQANMYDNYELITDKPITVQQWYEHQQKLIALIYPAITSRYIKLKKQQVDKYNSLRYKLLLESLPAGTQVSIKNMKYKSKQDLRYLTGYTVIRRTPQGPYLLRGPDGNLYNRLVPIEQLKPLRRLPVIQSPDSNDKQYVVERIIDHSDENADGTKQRQYLDKWAGYTQPIWQPLKDLEHCTQLIKEYWQEVRTKQTIAKPK